MKKINYFDLGLGPYPYELESMVRDVFPKFKNITYKAYGIEAHPNYIKTAEKLFKNENNIYLFNLAISNKKGIEKLYLQKNTQDGNLGNSIFETKNNVDRDKYIEVESDTFFSFLIKNNIDLNDSLNILKVNIEGAELYLWEDFKKNNIRDKFQILCGYKQHDIFKVSELEPKYNQYLTLIKELNINLIHFCHHGEKNFSVENMKKEISRFLN